MLSFHSSYDIVFSPGHPLPPADVPLPQGEGQLEGLGHALGVAVQGRQVVQGGLALVLDVEQAAWKQMINKYIKFTKFVNFLSLQAPPNSTSTLLS